MFYVLLNLLSSLFSRTFAVRLGPDSTTEQSDQKTTQTKQLQDEEYDPVEPQIDRNAMESTVFDSGGDHNPGSLENDSDRARSVLAQRSTSSSSCLTSSNAPQECTPSITTKTNDENSLDDLQATVAPQECAQSGKLRQYDMGKTEQEASFQDIGDKFLDLKSTDAIPVQITCTTAMPNMIVSFKNTITQQSTLTAKFPNAVLLQHKADYEQREKATERVREMRVVSEHGAYVNSDCPRRCRLCKKCFEATVQMSRALKQHYDNELRIREQQYQELEKEKTDLSIECEKLKRQILEDEASINLRGSMDTEVEHGNSTSNNDNNKTNKFSLDKVRAEIDTLRRLSKWRWRYMCFRKAYDVVVQKLEEAKSEIRLLNEHKVRSVGKVYYLCGKLHVAQYVSQMVENCFDKPKHKSKIVHSTCSRCHRKWEGQVSSFAEKHVHSVLEQGRYVNSLEYDKNFARGGTQISGQVLDSFRSVEQQHTAQQLADISQMKTCQIQNLYMEHAQALDSQEVEIAPKEDEELKQSELKEAPQAQNDSPRNPDHDSVQDAREERQIETNHENDSWMKGNSVSKADVDSEGDLYDADISDNPDCVKEFENDTELIVDEDDTISSLSSSTDSFISITSIEASDWKKIQDWAEI